MAFQQFPTTISKKPCTVFAGIASEEKKLKQAPGSMPEDMGVEMPAMDAPAEVVGAKDWSSMEQTKQSYTQTSISHQPLMMIDAYLHCTCYIVKHFVIHLHGSAIPWPACCGSRSLHDQLGEKEPIDSEDDGEAPDIK